MMKSSQKRHLETRHVIFGAIAIAAFIASCGGDDTSDGGSSGACICVSSIRPGEYDHCIDSVDQAQCDRQKTDGGVQSAAFHQDTDCSSLGFTLRCSYDTSNVYRYPSYAPCP
jgi:hypothetical protein